MLSRAYTIAIVLAALSWARSISAAASPSGAQWTLHANYPDGTRKNLAYDGRAATLPMPAGSRWRCGVIAEAPDGRGTTSEILCVVRSGESAASRASCSRVGEAPVVAQLTVAEQNGQETTMAFGCVFP